MIGLSARIALRGIAQAPFSKVIVVATVAFVLLISSLLFLLLSSFSSAITDIKASYFITAYIDPAVPANREAEIMKNLKSIESVQSVQLVSKEAFLTNFSKYFPQISKDLSTLDSEAIPRYVKVRINANDDTIKMDDLQDKIKKISGIDSTELNRNRFNSLLEALVILKAFTMFLLGGAAVALLCILFNHFKLDTIFKKQLNTAMKWLGASPLQASLPFVIEGVLEGALGGMIAASMLMMSAKLFDERIGHLFSALGYSFKSVPLMPAAMGVIIIGFVAGGLGSLWASWLSVQLQGQKK